MYLIIDTETNGLPNTKGLEYCCYPLYNDIDKYNTSRIIQLSYMICDDKLNKLKMYDYIIKREKFLINNSEFHGITNEISDKDGNDFNIVIDTFYKELKNCSHIIAHNIGFDINVIKSELFRRNLFHIIIELDKKILICSMKKFKNTIKAKFKHNTNKIKDPSLKELYKFAFNKEIENAHNSKFDVINLHAAIKKITNGVL